MIASPSPVDHWRQLTEFALYELAAGGPDPHMRYAGKAAFPHGWQEIVWRAGVYMAFYNYASAEVVWQHWPYKDMMAAYTPGKDHPFPTWLKDNWKGLKTRRERRAVRTPAKMIVCLSDYAYWMREDLPTILKEMPKDPQDAYEVLWDATDDLPYFGRYARFKLLEFYRRYADVNIEMPDIRPAGGYSPRLTLAMLNNTRFTMSGGWLEPEEAYIDKPEALGRVDLAAAKVLTKMREELNLPIDYYTLEVMLCDYRQSWEGKRQYPGRSNDSELAYFHGIEPYWRERGHTTTELFTIRDALTPTLARGELNGWEGVREDLGSFLHMTGNTWSDLLYDYANLNAKREGVAYETIHDLARKALPAL